MAIPIYISRVPRTQVLAPLQMPCPSCYQTAVHHVVRHYFSVHVYHLPMVSTGTEYEYVCSNCRVSRKGPAPTGARAKPFLHRFGCFVFVGVPVLGLILYWAISSWISETARLEHLKEVAARESAAATLAAKTKEVVTASKDAKAAMEEARKRCFQGIDGALDALPKKVKVIDLPAQKPADPSRLVGAGYVIMKSSSGEHIPIPENKYFGKQACFAKVPKELEDAAHYGAIGAFVDPETILAQARALTDQAKAMEAPAVIVATDLACPNAKKKCAGAAVWMSTADKKALAVVRVEKAVEHGGDQYDRTDLATLLENETNKW